MDKKELKRRFEARGLSVEIKTEGVVEEEVVHLFNILVREVNRFMREEVMDRRGKELLSKLKGKEWNKTALETYKQATQDTTEEWVEGLRKLMSTWGKVLYVNKGRIGKGMQTDMYTRFYKFVKQLLDDREREAYHDGYTDGVTRCMDSLNKLEEDKNEGA